MTTTGLDIIKKVEEFLQNPETVLHKVLVYIFYNTKHEERRRRNQRHIGLRYARCNQYQQKP
jgi:hypothetical protein